MAKIDDAFLGISTDDRIKHEQDFYNNEEWKKNRSFLHKYYSIFTERRGPSVLRNDIVEKSASPETTVFLDYGCGDGEYLIKISEKIKAGIGIDISKKEIEIAETKRNSKGIRNICFYVMNAMHTNFSDATFDIIHGNAILHHLDLEKSLHEIKRILKKEGTAVFVEPLSINPVIELYRKLTPNIRTPDEQPFRRRELKIIQKYFPNSEIQYFGCFTLLGVMMRKSKYFHKILDTLYKIDEVFLGAGSPFKLFAWVCVLQLKK